jgi:hypothetical protein
MLRAGLALSDGHLRLLEVFSSPFGKRRTALLRKSGLHIPGGMRTLSADLGYSLLNSNRLVIKNISWITYAEEW